MSIFDNAINELFTKAAAAWPDIANNQLSSHTAAAMNWRELVSLAEDEADPSVGLGYPWMVFDGGGFEPDDNWGDANDVYSSTIRLYYVMSLTGSGGSRRPSSEIDQILSDRAESIRSQMHVAATNLQVVKNIGIDFSVRNQVNQLFLKRGWPFYALEVTISFIVGVSSEV